MHPKRPKAELANIPKIVKEYPSTLGAKPPIYQNIPSVFWEYWPIQRELGVHGLGYLKFRFLSE